jgi:hypothetical protein
MTLEQQIKALLEAKQKEDAKEEEQGQADRVEQEPAVKIENPMDPNLTSSETPEGEIAAADAQGEEMNGKMKPVKEDAQAEFEAAKAKAMSIDPNGDDQSAQFRATQGVQNTTDLDDSDADAQKRFEDAKAKAGMKVEESISDLLGDEFSAEFKLKAHTIFEAAVKDQVIKFQAKLQEEHNAAVAKLEQQFEEKFLQRSKHLEEETSDKIDGYLNFLAEEWKKENEVALEVAIKSELTESFINSLKTVFKEHYIDLPEDKVDLYAKVVEEKSEVETALATTVGSLAKLTEELNQIKREQIITEAAKDFSSMDKSRFQSLTEDFAFDDAESFKTKVGIVKKSFFGNKSTAAKEQLTEELVKTEAIVESNEPVNVIENTAMSAYVTALRKNKK